MNDLLIKLLELFCQIAGKVRDANEKSFRNILKVIQKIVLVFTSTIAD